MKRLRLGTTVRFMNRQGQEGLYADFLIAMVRRLGDQPTFTRQQMLVWFREGSPTLRFLVSEVDRVRLKKSGPKQLAPEDVPVAAKFYEDALRCAWIHCEVMYSALSAKERKELEKQFNDARCSVAILILMYDVGCWTQSGQRLRRCHSTYTSKESQCSVSRRTCNPY